MTSHKQRNNSRRTRHPTILRAGLCLLVAGITTVQPTNAFVSQSTGVGHTALHAEMTDNGGVALPPELQQALDSKNASRQKFGLEPISAPQFLELQNQIAEMEQEQASKAARMYQQQEQTKASKNGLGNFAKTLFLNAMEDSCYSNFDCESPKVCCDLGFKKMCCANGMMQVQHEYAMEPVPVDMRE